MLHVDFKNLKIEFLGGLAIFFSIWTISFLYVNIMQGFSLPFELCFFNICLLMTTGCILSAIFLKQPFVIAPGLSIGWFAYAHIFPQASVLNFCICIILSGIILTIISFSKLIRETKSLLPLYLQQTLSIGIGLLFLRLSLTNQLAIHPDFSSIGLYLFSLISLIFFRFQQNRFGVLISVILTFILNCFIHGLPNHGLFQLPHGPQWLWQNHLGKLHHYKLVKQTIEMVLFSFFDGAIGVYCLQQIQGMLHLPPKTNSLAMTYRSVGLNNILSGLIMGGPNTLYIESAIGMQVGARQPLAILFVALFFMIFMFCLPFGQMIPKELFHAILGFIGLSLLTPIYQLRNNTSLENLIVVGLIGLMIITKSILNGLIIGILIQYLMNIKTKQEITLIQHLASLFAVFSLLLTIFHL